MEALQLSRSKLHRPRSASDLVHRTRVTGLLNASPLAPLALVCAPAGSGKTTLVNDWLDACPWRSAWVSLDKEDDDLDTFLSYFVAAIRTLFPRACGSTAALLAAPASPPSHVLTAALIDDLDRISVDVEFGSGERFVLVIDDYHLLQQPRVDALLHELLQRPPGVMRLVLITRQEPALPLDELRAKGQLIEIRAGDLLFTRDEVAAFLEQTLWAMPDRAMVDAIARRSEGWATGLRMAALALSTGGDIPGNAVEAGDHYALDYLLNEVLLHVPPATQDFLLKTSILDRLNGSLCDAVTGDEHNGGRTYLRWLARENMFTQALNDEGGWYRYHGLFQKLLATRLQRQGSGEQVAELHRRASAWLAQNGFVDEAIGHSIAAGDETAVVNLIERNRHDAMNREQWRLLEHRLSLLPRRLIDNRPELVILEAWIAQKQWRSNDLPGYLGRAETLLEHESLPEGEEARLRSEIDALRSQYWHHQLDGQRIVEAAARSLANAPLEYDFVRQTAWLYYAAGQQMLGQNQAAIDAAAAGIEEGRRGPQTGPLKMWLSQCAMCWVTANVVKLRESASEMLQLAGQRELVEDSGWARFWRGCARYQLNDLPGAEADFSAVIGLRYATHAFSFSQSIFGLASVLLIRGEVERARELADMARGFALETNNERMQRDAEAFRAWLASRTGNPAEAAAWAIAVDPAALRVPLNTFAAAPALHAQVLLGLRTPSSLALAEYAITRLTDLAASTYNTRYLIEAHALRGLLEDRRGHRAAALDKVEEAVRLAAPGGALRVFVDLGPEMAALLKGLVARNGPTAYLRKVISAFPPVEQVEPLRDAFDEGGAGSSEREPGDGARHDSELIEPISERELDVLELLADRYTNEEIARALHIAPSTVKRHTVNIYQKLGVNGRRAAVARAVELGLIAARR